MAGTPLQQVLPPSPMPSVFSPNLVGAAAATPGMFLATTTPVQVPGAVSDGEESMDDDAGQSAANQAASSQQFNASDHAMASFGIAMN